MDGSPKLPGAGFQRLQDALVDAFPAHTDLAQMVRKGLGENLEVIAGQGNLGTVVFALIEWADAHGKLDALIAAARSANPGNPVLRAFVREQDPDPRQPSPPRTADTDAVATFRDAPPPPSAPLPPPPDALYDPRFYVHRPDAEKRALAKLAVAGSPLVLWAPERFGKSTMLRYLLARVEEEDAQAGKETLVIEADLGALLPEGPAPTADAFLGRFARHLLDEVRAGDAAFEAIARDDAPWANKLRYLMEDHVLPRARGRLLLVLDKADALWGEPAVQGAFYAALRGWKERGKRGWPSLRLVLLLSTTPALVFEDPEHRDSPFYNLTADVIELRDLTPEQSADLAHLHGLPWTPADLAHDVHPFLGGHPYLLRVLMFQARLTGAAPSTLAGDEDALLQLYDVHLSALGQLVDRDPTLRRALEAVLDDPGAPVDEGRFQRLRRAGLAIRTAKGIEVPYRLYERYLRLRWRTTLPRR